MNRCLSCLKELDKNKICNSCLKLLFNKRKVNPVLNFNKKDFLKIRTKLVDKFSISGVQDKISLKIHKDKLIHTDKDGEFILKPIPINPTPEFNDDVPANEHITLQIAKQVFRIKIAENSLIYFSDDELAFISKRFDRKNNRKLQQEDFCQVLNKTPENVGKNYKYDGSYEQIGKSIIKNIPAYMIEIEKYFHLVIFNYVFGNGDAHLKNFSILESDDGDYVLSPAYDVLNTGIHFPTESRLALDLFTDLETESFKINGFYKRLDFLELARKLKIKKFRAERFLDEFVMKKGRVYNLIKVSFLSKDAKSRYLELFDDRIKAIK